MASGAWQIDLADADATAAFGADLARAVIDAQARSLLILLKGELGAGKTTLGRGFLRAFGHTGPVPSPTYTLLEPYRFDGFEVNHLDLYRLGDDSELEYLGWRDLADSVCLVEWPERAPTATADADLRIELGLRGAGRHASIDALSSTGAAVLSYLPDDLADHYI